MQEDSDVVSEGPGESERSMRREDRGEVVDVSEVSGAEQREKRNHFARVCICFWKSEFCSVAAYVSEA